MGTESIQIVTTPQPNRVLVDKSSTFRLVIPEEVVMQPRFTVGILVLQAEGLMRRSCYVRFALQFAPTVIIAEPQQITVLIGHLSWDADLVAVEVVGLLAAFGNQSVEDVVGKAVARTVFITDG